MKYNAVVIIRVPSSIAFQICVDKYFSEEGGSTVPVRGKEVSLSLTCDSVTVRDERTKISKLKRQSVWILILAGTFQRLLAKLCGNNGTTLVAGV